MQLFKAQNTLLNSYLRNQPFFFKVELETSCKTKRANTMMIYKGKNGNLLCEKAQCEQSKWQTNKIHKVLVAVKRKITYPLSHLHPKLDLWWRERVSLLAKRLTRAHEGSRLVRGAALVQVNYPLVALVGRQRSWGFS